MDAKPAADSRAQITHWMGVTDANSAGQHPRRHDHEARRRGRRAGGDQALAPARGHRRRWTAWTSWCPIYVGELVTFSATVNAAWRTSMEVGVRVEAENPLTGELAPHQHRLPDDGRARRRRRARAGPAAARRRRRPSSAACARPSCGAPTAWPSESRSSRTARRGRGPAGHAVARARLANLAERPAAPPSRRLPEPWIDVHVAAGDRRQRGPVPGPGADRPRREVSRRIPAISTNAWPGLV